MEKDLQEFFKVFSEHREKFADLFSNDESDTASVKEAMGPTGATYKKGDLSENLMKELECPVCMEYMSPPIMMCCNGHSVCNTCRQKLKKCPNCRKSFLSVRNIALENIVRKLEVPCPNAKYGCQLSFPSELISEYENFCIHRPYKCPLSDAQGISCNWFAAYANLKQHIESVHRDRLTVLTSDKRVFIKKFDYARKYSRIIFMHNEIFYQEFLIRDGIFYFVIQHVGPENCALKFRYLFSLPTYKNIESIEVAFVARSSKVNIENIYKSGQCVKLHFDTVRNFMEGKDTLAFRFDIDQANGKRFDK